MFARIAQLVERIRGRDEVTGSMPVAGPNAEVAQQAEQLTRNEQAAGSIPALGPIFDRKESCLQCGDYGFFEDGKPCNCIQNAGVAQLAEHLICNQEVGGSTPLASPNSTEALGFII